MNPQINFARRVLLAFSGLLACALFFIALPTPRAQAATLTITTTSETSAFDKCTLRDAIIAANTNTTQGTCVGAVGADVINFSVGGTINLTGTLPAIAEALTINGGGNIIVNGGDAYRIFNVNSGIAFNVYSMTLRNGLGGADAGALQNNGGTVSISNTTFLSNTAPTGGIGGAIFNSSGTTNIFSSAFSYNSAATNGGAIYLRTGTLPIANTTFFSNTTIGNGGALKLQGGAATITGTNFLTNTAALDGGALDLFGVALNLQGSTLSGNAAGSQGGGIYSLSQLTLANSTVSNNKAFASSGAGGGGIYATGPGLCITGSVVSLNTATATPGGGIYNNYGLVTIVNSHILTNSATGTGGILSNDGHVNITGSNINGNSAVLAGAGALSFGKLLTVTTSIFSGNISNSQGGAITDGCGVTATITSSTFTNNYASGSSGSGGAICNCGTLTITNTTISGNRADTSGGALYRNGGTVRLNNATIVFNNGDNSNGGYLGGGIFNIASTYVRNSIIALNSAGGGGPDCYSSLIDLGNNLVGNNTDCIGLSGSLIGTGTNPINPKSAPLMNLGGLTRVHGLLNGSPAINAGSNTTCASTDQRGIARSLTVGEMCDIGAFEGSLPVLYLALILR